MYRFRQYVRHLFLLLGDRADHIEELLIVRRYVRPGANYVPRQGAVQYAEQPA